MLAGEFSKAQTIFAEVGTNPATRQPTRNWARFNSGLCALFTGDPAAALARGSIGGGVAAFAMEPGIARGTVVDQPLSL